MRFQQLALATAALLLTGVSSPAQDSVKEFVSEAGSFAIRGPGQPRHSVKDVKTDVGTVKLHQFVFELGEAAFIASYTDYPKAPAAGQEGRTLDGAEAGFVRNVNGTVSRSKAIKLQRYPGREFELKTPGNLEMSARIYLVGTRLYQLVVGWPSGRPSRAEGIRFLESFRLLKPGEKAPPK